ncbi:hypothetical protein [Rhizobium lentis]|uniref:Ribbon-helix-helix protein, CopG family n=1 Tax=Rhizobium lentis TaxID=1138194 RepID=A0ABS7IBV9_9HYPH|nr:hypothetical protein [Rhizobium lentis]MBX5089377.1 hypothetical protein [Rhizobium lentis]
MTAATITGDYRYFRKKVSGHTENCPQSLKRVAISFTQQQIDAINNVAEERGVSFSKAVSMLADRALAEALA